jgi:hypothetical protein
LHCNAYPAKEKIMRLAATLAAMITLLLSASGDAVAAAPLVPRMERVDHCSWDRPGHNPFMGDVVAAIDRYTEIPTPVRMRLKQRMQARQYDDLVDIRRDEIRGRARYEPAIRDMHFGIDRVCRQVSRAGWTAQMHERGLVYCEAGHCILVPTVCRNVSRIERLPSAVTAAQDDTPVGAPQGRATASPSADLLSGSKVADAASTVPAAPAAGVYAGTVPSTVSFSEVVNGTAPPLWPAGGGGGVLTSPGAAPPSGTSRSNVQAEPARGFSWPPIALGGGPVLYVPGGSTAPGSTAGGNPGGRHSGELGGDPILGGTPADGRDGGNGGSGVGSSLVLTPAIGGAPTFSDAIGGIGDPFRGIGSPLGHGAVTPVPEPSTWLSLLVGLAVVAGATARRRRNTAMAQDSAGAPRRAVQERA